MQIKTNFKRVFILTILLVWGLFLIVACTNASSEPTVDPASEQEEEHDAEGSHDEEEGHSEERIPNEGAVIRILAPTDELVIHPASAHDIVELGEREVEDVLLLR